MTAPASLFLVFSNPVTGQEAAYHAWYARHLRQILRLKPFTAARMFEVHPTEARPGPGRRFMVTYEVEGAPEDAVTVLRHAVTEGKVEAPDPTCVEVPLDSFFYTPIGTWLRG